MATNEGFDANTRDHVSNELRKWPTLLIRMHQNRHHAFDDCCEFASFTGSDSRLTPCGFLRSVGACRGIEQRQARYPLPSLPEDFQRDVAAHGKSGEGELWRRRIEYDARHLHHSFAFSDRRNAYLGNVAKMRDLVTPDGGVANQARDEQQILIARHEPFL